MRIAFAGKGGAGKTTIAACMARLAARTEEDALALDADSNPNLAVALGLAPEVEVPTLPTSLVSRRFDGPALTRSLDEVVASHTVPAPDGVRIALMGMPGHAGEGCMCAAHATVAALLDDLGRQPERTTVVDLEASPEHLSRGTARHVDALLLVVEPYFRSLETVRRMAILAAELPIPQVAVIANKVRRDDDLEAVRAFCRRHELRLLGSVPYSEGVLDADRAHTSMLDHGVPAVVEAIEGLRVASRTAVTPHGA